GRRSTAPGKGPSTSPKPDEGIALYHFTNGNSATSASTPPTVTLVPGVHRLRCKNASAMALPSVGDCVALVTTPASGRSGAATTSPGFPAAAHRRPTIFLFT